MAIPEKGLNECSQVKVDLCGDAKLRVREKQDELKAMGLPHSKAFAIIKLILGK